MRDWDAEKTARDPKIDRENLETLARSWDWHVRRAVGGREPLRALDDPR